MVYKKVIFLLILKHFFDIVGKMKKDKRLVVAILLILFIPSVVLSAGNKITSKSKKSKVSKIKSTKEGKNIISHRVKKGDTPAKLAKQYGVSIEEILKSNQNINPKNLKVGSIIKIPARHIEKIATKKDSEKTVYIVKKGDTLYSISKKYSISVDEIKKLNNLRDTSLAVGTQLVLKKDYLVYRPKNKQDRTYTLREVTDDAIDNDEGEVDDEEKDLKLVEKDKELIYDNKELDLRNIKYTLTDGDVNKLIASALDYIGASYKYGGNHPASIDCSAFVKRVFSEVNIPLPRTSREQFELGVEVPLEQLAEGDLLFFKRKKRIGHVGIYIGDNMFIHAAGKGKGVIISPIDSPYFKKTFVGAKRLFIKESDKANLQGKNLSLVEKPLVN